jgi:hypothetical protein
MTPKTIPLLTLALPIALLASCASSSKRNFESITPGMTQNEVRAAMGDGPTRFEQVEQTPYSRWFWGDAYCVLFNESNKVVAKDSTQTGRNVEVGPGKYEEKKLASCPAPGQVAETSGPDRTVEIPGVGSIHLPKSKLKKGS